MWILALIIVIAILTPSPLYLLIQWRRGIYWEDGGFLDFLVMWVTLIEVAIILIMALIWSLFTLAFELAGQ